MCGEHILPVIPSSHSLGSSPRVRGTRGDVAWRPPGAGIIPACAGNTLLFSGRHFTRRDHPRVCGEHFVLSGHALLWRGSSPRVRGTLLANLDIVNKHGIIPACAGNTEHEGVRERSSRDHPRVCGEHSRPAFRIVQCGGSSPRVRGTLSTCLPHRAMRGIIPACAGNTDGDKGRSARTRDHPRVCGEHLIAGLVAALVWGSSPRVRGTPPMALRPFCSPGIIPACAGNTMVRRLWRVTLRDHPRVCGEHRLFGAVSWRFQGSSPRVRGTPLSFLFSC